MTSRALSARGDLQSRKSSVTTASAEFIYKDKSGRALALYYLWTIDAAGQAKLNAQLVNYSNVTWVDIVLKCDTEISSRTIPATSEIPIYTPVFDFELTKDINDISVGPIQPNAKLICSIVRANRGEATLRPARR